jgi:hypothetical protein
MICFSCCFIYDEYSLIEIKYIIIVQKFKSHQLKVLAFARAFPDWQHLAFRAVSFKLNVYSIINR